MRKVWLMLLCACGGERYTAPKPATISTVALAERAVGDTAQYTLSYVLSRNPRTTTNGGPDTVRMTMRRDSSLGVPRVDYGARNRFTQRDTAQFKVPRVFGAVAKYAGCIQIRKNATLSTKCHLWETNLAAKPDTTPPTIDTVRVDSVVAIIVKPDSNKVLQADWEAVGVYFRDTLGTALYSKTGTKLTWTCPGGGAGKCPQKWFCGFARMSTGVVVMTTNSAPIPTCQALFNQIPGHAATFSPLFHGPGGVLPLAIAVNTSPTGVVYVGAVTFNHKRLERARNGDWVDPDNAVLLEVPGT